MKYAVAAVTILVVVIGISAVLRNQPTGGVEIHLSSEPFPLAVGQSTLLVSLIDGEGAPVEGATVEVNARMAHEGMLPVAGQAIESNGQYRAFVTLPMMGEWIVDVIARLPQQPAPLQERFEVYVYPIVPPDSGNQTRYRSVSEIDNLFASRPSDEYWIVIPMGTQALMRSGQGDDVIPEEIRLDLSGRHVLVIRNDDIADHVVGPFFVRSGEIIRQRFTSPAEFQGVCTIRHGAEVSIIVES